jgi:hypothetical protein
MGVPTNLRRRRAFEDEDDDEYEDVLSPSRADTPPDS